MSVGAVYEGREGRLRLPFRVSAAETFPSISAVWSTLTRRGQTHLLFPPGLQADLGVPVHTSEDAARLYATLTGITRATGKFTLYTLQALKGGPPDVDGPSPIVAGAVGPSLTPDAPRPVVKLLPTRRVVGRLLAVWAGERADGGGLDLVGGMADRVGAGWETSADALRRELGEELPLFPAEAIHPLERALATNPHGLSQRHLDLSKLRRPRASQIVRYWQLPTAASDGCPSDWARGGELERHEWKPSTAGWVLPTRLLRAGHPIQERYTAGMLAALACDPSTHTGLSSSWN